MLALGCYLRALWERIKPEEGQDFIEYALVLGVITLVLIAAFLLTDIEGAVTQLANKTACSIKGMSFTPPSNCA